MRNSLVIFYELHRGKTAVAAGKVGLCIRLMVTYPFDDPERLV
jgi:hypothetical protein